MYYAVSKVFNDEHLTFEVNNNQLIIYSDHSETGTLEKSEWIELKNAIDLFFLWAEQKELLEDDTNNNQDKPDGKERILNKLNKLMEDGGIKHAENKPPFFKQNK
jgi:hypothetical protein